VPGRHQQHGAAGAARVVDAVGVAQRHLAAFDEGAPQRRDQRGEVERGGGGGGVELEQGGGA
jgi:hypothetical protein